MTDDVAKVAGYVSVSREMLGDWSPATDYLRELMGRWLTPWLYPDPNPMPEFEPFPRLAWAIAKGRRWAFVMRHPVLARRYDLDEDDW